MSNLEWQFLDCNSNPLSSTKILFTPTKAPETTGSCLLSVADSYQFTSSISGTISASVVPSTYRVDISSPLPAHYFYIGVTETGSFLVSGSATTGSAQCVDFELINLVKDPFSVKKVSVTPTWTYPTTYSGSQLIVLSTTSSKTDTSGSVNFDALFPGIYECTTFGKVETTFYISVPAWNSTGDHAPCWCASELLVVKPAKGIKVKLNNLDNSYVLTVSASDARYVQVGGTIQGTASWAQNTVSSSWAEWSGHAISASYAPVSGEVDNAISASHAVFSDSGSYAYRSSNADSASWAPLQTNVDSSSWSGNSLSASHALQSDRAISASYAPIAGEVANAVSASHALYADSTNLNVTVSWANSASWAPPTTIPDTSSYANFALSASWAPDPTIIPDTASYANFALSASWAPMPQVSDSASWASSSVSSSFAERTISSSYSIHSETATSSSHADFSLVAGYATSAANSTSASYADMALSASWAPDVTVTVDSASWASASLSASTALKADTTPNWRVDIDPTSYYSLGAEPTQGSALMYGWNSGGNAVNLLVLNTASCYIGASGVPFTVMGPLTASEGIKDSTLTSGMVKSDAYGVLSNVTTSDTIEATASVAISASWAPATPIPDTSSYADFATSASWAPATPIPDTSSYANFALSASWAPDPTIIPDTASFALSADSASWVPDLYPQTYQESASWASSSVSSSFADVAQVAMYATSANDALTSTSASHALYADSTNTNITVSYADFATSASWAPMPVIPSTDSASWASQSFSASYAERAGFADSATDAQTAQTAAFVSSASHADRADWADNFDTNVTVSYADNSLSASWAPPTPIPETSSYADFATSASWAPMPFVSDSSSWASQSFSSSFADKALLADSASYAPPTPIPDTSSYANFALSASWAPMPVIPSTESSSWASSSLSASHALIADNAGTASYLKGRGEVSSSLLFQPIVDPIDEQEGRLFYSSDTKALTIMGIGETRLQLGQEEYTLVYNKTGEQIDNGTLVAFAGDVQGAEPCVKKAIAGIGHEFCVLGMTTMDIPDSDIGLVTTYGMVNGIDTQAITSGSVIYLSNTTSGSYTTTEPPYPYSKIRVGAVIKQHSNGSIYIRIQNHSVDTATTSSYAVQASNADASISSSWASSSLSSSFAIKAGTADSATSSSYASNSLSSSYSERTITSSYAIRTSIADAWSGSGYVPLSGSITFYTNSIYTPPHKTGHMYWDEQDKTVAVCLGTETRLQIGEEVLLRVHAGENIPNGGVVYNTGTSFYNPTVGTHRAIVRLAQADGTNTRAVIMGVATETITSGSAGFITVIGDVHGLNTDGMSEGATAYLSTTQSGSFTTTRPQIPSEIVIVGNILETDAVTGTITVNIANPPDLSIASLVSAGMTSLPTIALSGSGTTAVVNMSTGSCMLYNTPTANDKLTTFLLQTASLAMPNTGSTYYIVADYNSGSPAYKILTSNSTIDHIQIVPVFTAIRTIYGAFETLSWKESAFGLADKMKKRFVRTRRFEFETIPTIAESGSRYLAIGSAAIWYAENSVATIASNTRIDGLRYFWHNAASSTGWTSSLETAGQIDNQNYDNGTTKTALSVNKYGVAWLFKPVSDTDTETYAVYGMGDYTLAQAQASTVPGSLPAILGNAGTSVLIGRAIIQKSATNTTQIDVVGGTTTFVAGGVSDHNALSNLQGGATSEYYHLTAAEYTGLQSKSASFASSSFTSSYAVKSSTADSATSASYAGFATSASWSPATVAVASASFASSSFSSSYAVKASTADSATSSTTSTSASYAGFATSASWAPDATTASYANFALSSSWAPATVAVASASWASQSLSASWAPSTIAVNSASWAGNCATASYISQSIWFPTVTSSYFPFWLNGTLTTSSWFQQLSSSLSASVPISGTLIGTASWANNATTASYATKAVNADTASYATNAATNTLSPRLAYDTMLPSLRLGQTLNMTQSLYQIAGGFIDDYVDTTGISTLGSLSQSNASNAGTVDLPMSSSGANSVVATALLPFDAASTTDSSGWNRSITVVAASGSIDVSGGKYGGALTSSNLVAKSPYTAYLFDTSSVFEIAASASFTIECWVRMASATSPSGQTIVWSTTDPKNNTNGITLGRHFANSTPIFAWNGGASYQLGTTNAWQTPGNYHHIAYVRSSSYKACVYVDGVAALSWDKGTALTVGGGFSFGGYSGSAAAITYFMDGLWGNIDDFRFLNGTCSYTAAFTPPTAAFPTGGYVPSSLPQFTSSLVSHFRSLPYTASSAYIVLPVKVNSGSIDNLQVAVTLNSGSTYTSMSLTNEATFTPSGANVYCGVLNLTGSNTGSYIGYKLSSSTGSFNPTVYGVGLLAT